MISVETEVVKCAPANSIRVLILRKRFAVPSYGIAHLGHSPWCAAVTLVVKRSIVCPTGFLRRCMKTGVADIHSGCQSYTERLNPAIKVLVEHGILIVPDPSSWVAHLVAHEPDAIVTGIGLNLAYCSSCPCHDGRLHPHRGTNARKCEIRWAAADGKLTVGSVVVHVALPRMRLAPGVFMRGNILSFAEIDRARILRWIQVAHCHRDPVRCASVTMATVIVCARSERPRKRIHPCA